ncbi:hypothetical protein GCM10020218_097230 [Dactylosporangium vinaceum]
MPSSDSQARIGTSVLRSNVVAGSAGPRRRDPVEFVDGHDPLVRLPVDHLDDRSQDLVPADDVAQRQVQRIGVHIGQLDN